ncbi:MAG TPA: peptide deformylase [Steroidobacteraceae bacterium]|nr:peptide deformylase [Steroidobacteraceae bacterium]
MSVREVLRMGDARLLQVSQPVGDIPSAELSELLTDMHDTMRAHDGAGIAAPQIGVLQRVVIFGLTHNPRYPDAEPVPQTVLVNPQIELLDDETEDGWEGCLSVPGMRGLVPRFKKLRYTGCDENAQPIDRTVTGFHARVVQHEVDHLDGVLYPTRIRDLRQFGFSAALFPGQDLPDE